MICLSVIQVLGGDCRQYDCLLVRLVATFQAWVLQGEMRSRHSTPASLGYTCCALCVVFSSQRSCMGQASPLHHAQTVIMKSTSAQYWYILWPERFYKVLIMAHACSVYSWLECGWGVMLQHYCARALREQLYHQPGQP